MRIVSLDPGGTTGYVIYCTGVPGGIYTYGHLGPEDHHYKLRTLLEECAAYQESMYIVYERFDPRNNDFAKLISVEYIGVIKAFNQASGVPIVAQGSSIKPHKAKATNQATGWATDEKLQQLGLLLTPKSTWKHANDAMRHLVYFVCHNPIVPTKLSDQFFAQLKPT